ncbi:MAG: putative lipid II flippase FtsW [Candidatus Omnitrophica bacterium]|nr:putative lipid II flippase FtsW [Candidatus Omnitrophota bacterium]
MSFPARVLFIAVYLLVSVGIVMTYSASAVYAEQIYGNSMYFLIRQLIFVIIGTFFMILTAMSSVHFWKKHSREVILFAILMMILVFVPGVGREAGGAQRWIRLGAGINFQPVEFAKIAVCIYLSDYMTRKIKVIKQGSLPILIPPMILIGGVCGLSLLQPDLGSTVIILLVTSILIFMAGIKMRYVFIAFSAMIPVFYMLVARVPYRMSRITAYLNPWEDPQGSGFQIIQSFLAFGMGGIKGVGLGQSTQKLFYLPSSYNDFIFSVIGEELGLIGMLFVLTLYAVIFICGIQIAGRAKSDHEKMMTTALIMLILFQALINVLVATGLIPTKGLPLPFVSYGGTSIVFNLMAVGFLLCLDRASYQRRAF